MPGRCNGCLCMAAEDWPKGVKVCRCMDPGEPDGSIRPYGRVLEVFRLGEVGPVVTPAWCRRTGKDLSTPALRQARNVARYPRVRMLRSR